MLGMTKRATATALRPHLHGSPPDRPNTQQPPRYRQKGRGSNPIDDPHLVPLERKVDKLPKIEPVLTDPYHDLFDQDHKDEAVLMALAGFVPRLLPRKRGSMRPGSLSMPAPRGATGAPRVRTALKRDARRGLAPRPLHLWPPLSGNVRGRRRG